MAAAADEKKLDGIGSGPYKIPPSLYQNNRRKVWKSFQEGADAKAIAAQHAAVFVQGGKEAYRHDSDHEPLFRQESNFFYLFGINEPDCYGCIDLANGQSVLFIPRHGLDYEVWCGKIKPPSWYQSQYGVDCVAYTDEIVQTLKARGITVLCLLHGKNTDSGNYATPAAFDGLDQFTVNTTALFDRLMECRVFKSDEEMDVMRYVAGVSSAAHIEVMKSVSACDKEYQLESIFKHHCLFHGGCRQEAYTCICASAGNSATLHYGHAGAPNDRKFDGKEILLLDMGVEYNGYCSDITCSFPANGVFTPEQREVYDAVYDAQLAVMAAMKPGVKWPDMHRLAERTILQHLVDKQFVLANGKTLEQLHALHLPAIFMPHGLGHFLGLDTHDVGGYPPGVERINEPGISRLRTARVLKERMVITVEPGLYFIPALIDRALANADQAPHLNKDKLDKFRTFGGVRIEDDVIVTATGIENITKCPRKPEEIEAIMKEQHHHHHHHHHDDHHHHHHAHPHDAHHHH